MRPALKANYNQRRLRQPELLRPSTSAPRPWRPQRPTTRAVFKVGISGSPGDDVQDSPRGDVYDRGAFKYLGYQSSSRSEMADNLRAHSASVSMGNIAKFKDRPRTCTSPPSPSPSTLLPSSWWWCCCCY